MPSKDEILQLLNAPADTTEQPASKRDAIRTFLDQAEPPLDLGKFVQQFAVAAAKQLYKSGSSVVETPGLVSKAQSQPLSDAERETLQESAATLGSIPGASMGATAGGAVGGLVGGLLTGGPGAVPGAAIGATLGGGFGGGAMYEALKAKRHDPRPVSQRVKDTALAGLFGAGVNVLLVGAGRALGLGKRVKPVPAAPTQEIPPALATMPEGTAPDIEIPKRVATHGSSLNPDDVVAHSPDLDAAGDAMREGARIDFGKAPQMETIADQTRNAIWDSKGEEEFRKYVAGQRAHDMKKLFTEAEQEDMTFFREKTQNPYIQGDTPEGPIARLSPQAKAAVQEGVDTMNGVRDLINETGTGEDVGFFENYITHLWKPPAGMSESETRKIASKWATNAVFQNKRTFETFVQGIEEAGFVPRTTRFPELVQAYENMGARIIAQNRLVNRLENTVLAESGTPALIRRGVESEVEAASIPKDYESIRIGKKMYSAHPDVADELKLMMEQPFSGKWIRRLETVNAYVKKAQLSVSAFHHFALGETTFGMGAFNPRYLMPDAPIEAMRRGGQLLRDPEFVEDAMRAGLTMAPPSDVQVTRIRNLLTDVEAATRGTPVVGKVTKTVRQANDLWDDALWTYEHNRMKATMFYELNRYYLKRYPEMGARDIQRSVAEVVNNTLGGQNWERSTSRFVRSARGRQILHWLLLAPDWTLSQLKVGRTAIYSRNPIIRDASRRSLAAHAAALYVYGNLMNYGMTSLSGQPHFLWENDPGHEFDVELPWKDPKGAKLYAGPAKAVKELYRWADPHHFFESAREQFGNKLAPALRNTLLQLTGYSMGGFPAPFNPERMVMQGERPTFANIAFERAKSIAGEILPFAVRSEVKFSPWPISKGTTMWNMTKAMEEAIEDNSPDRLAHLAQVARENGLNADMAFNIALANVNRRKRKANRRAAAE